MRMRFDIMKYVCEENMCTGCMACTNVCAKNAITVADKLKSYNAVIDISKCINCKLCHNVCQQNADLKGKKTIEYYQGWAKDQGIREGSSSGGIAAVLARAFVENHGIVCSCVFRNGKFGFEIFDTVNDLHKYAGSKYVKSDPKDIYKNIKKLLMDNKKVLFIGLPCQAAALKRYIGEKYEESLYLVDLICHGTPSPKILDNYLNCYSYSLSTLQDIKFRNNNRYQVCCDGKAIVPKRLIDSYIHAFLNSLIQTENCYHCRYASVKRISDITIGDSWGSELDSDEVNKGVSLILCQTIKGADLIKSADIHLEYVDINKAVEANAQLNHPSEMPAEREKFFRYIDKGCDFNTAMKKCYPKIYFKQDIKKLLLKLKIIDSTN